LTVAEHKNIVIWQKLETKTQVNLGYLCIHRFIRPPTVKSVVFLKKTVEAGECMWHTNAQKLCTGWPKKVSHYQII